MALNKFLSDSVVNFHETGLSGVSDRAIRVVKMRRTAHVRGPVGMKITNTGIDIIPPSLDLSVPALPK